MAVTRRDFVALLLGAPLAAACRGSAPKRIPPGALIDTGAKRGHAAVRDGKPPVPTRWRDHQVVIVGGGVAGLSAAWELRRSGITDVVVLELDDNIGGTARGGVSSITPYPWGAHYIVSPQSDQTNLIALLTEMNAIEGHAPDGTPIASEALRCRELEERVFHLGRWYEGLYLDAGSSADDRAQHARFNAEISKWALFRDSEGRRAFSLPAAHSSSLPALRALDNQTFAAWLDERKLTSERLRWHCDYACRDDYGLLAADTSAWAGLFYFAARRAGVDGHHEQPVLTWPDGNASLVRHLAQGIKFETNVAVSSISDDGTITALTSDGPIGFRAKHVVVATPSFIADRIVKTTTPRAIVPHDYGAWAVANLHLHDRPREKKGAPPAWDSVIRNSPSLGYVSATHQQGRDRGPTVLTWFYPFTGPGPEARTKVLGAGYEEWAEVVLSDIERAHPDIRELVDHMEVAFWGHGMIRPRVGHLFHENRPARIAAHGALHFAHTDLSGIALFEEAFDHGIRAAREIVVATSP